MRVVLVVKYFPPLPRVSGIIGFLGVLSDALGHHVDLHVVTHRPRGDSRKVVERPTSTVHRVAGPFPVAAARAVRRLNPAATIVVSGIHDLRQAGPYFATFSELAPKGSRQLFYQATHASTDFPASLRLALRRYDEILAASPVIARTLQPSFEQAVRVFSPAVDIPAIASAPSPLTRIGFVNHFNHVKGADLAIPIIQNALDRVDGSEAVVAGTGELEGAMAAAFSADSRVRLAGFLGDDERLDLIDSCDIMLLPFRTAVSVLGVSQTALEAMAAGNVVIGTDTDAINGAIEHGRNGLLGTEAELDALVAKVQTDAALRLQLGDAARTDATVSWSIESRVRSLLDLLGTSAT